MQDEERPPEGFDANILRDGEVGFDLLAYLMDHPIVAAVIIVVVLVFFFWVMRRRTRR